MLRHLPKGVLIGVALSWLGSALLLSPMVGHAQERDILVSQVSVSGQEASLLLEFADGDVLSVVVQPGRLALDGVEAARFPAGGGLETSWRDLLAQAIAAEPSELPDLLLGWLPPAGLPDDADRAAAVLRSRLADELARTRPGAVTPALSLEGDPRGRGALEALVRSVPRLQQLGAALGDLQLGDVRVHAGEAVRIDEGETLPASLVMIDGDLIVLGTIEGDVVLLGGRAELGPEGRVTGVLRWADAQVVGNRAGVGGTIEEVVPISSPTQAPFRTGSSDPAAVGLREQIRQEVLEATRDATASRQAMGRRSGSPLTRIGEGFAGLFQTVLTFGILLASGLAVLYFFPRHLEVVARTARSTTARAALVGLAGMVLVIPIWVVGIVLLAVSIIGIPALIVWVPALPLVFAVALAFGYLAVARNVGQWISHREIPALSGLDTTRPAVHIGAGLVLLLGAFALAHVFRMGGAWLGFFRGALLVAGVSATVIAICVGLGAVILSRAGRDPAFAGPGWGPVGEEGPETA